MPPPYILAFACRRTLPHAQRVRLSAWFWAAVAAGLCLHLPARAHEKPEKPDEVALPALMTQAGFVPPEGFKALVMVLPARGQAQAAPRLYDWHGTSDDRDDWWPASTVKLYAAVGALQAAHRLGFGPRALVTTAGRSALRGAICATRARTWPSAAIGRW